MITDIQINVEDKIDVKNIQGEEIELESAPLIKLFKVENKGKKKPCWYNFFDPNTYHIFNLKIKLDFTQIVHHNISILNNMMNDSNYCNDAEIIIKKMVFIKENNLVDNTQKINIYPKYGLILKKNNEAINNNYIINL